MELYIDNVQVDTDAEVAVSLSVASMSDPRKGRVGYSIAVGLPATAKNDAVLGFAADVNARDRFNASAHTGRIEHEGVVLSEGPLVMKRCERQGTAGRYEVCVAGASGEWAAKAAAKRLRYTNLNYSRVLSGSAVQSSWSDSLPVKFFPVARDRREADFSGGGLVSARKVLSSEDYHPFISIKALLVAIFAESGYRVESELVVGELFSSLYMSGNYTTRDVSALKSKMDFLARREGVSSAVADDQGKVYADPLRAGGYTVGGIVDAPRAIEGDVQGAAFSRGGCLSVETNGRIVFVPTEETSMGFQYHLRYTTDYRIKSRIALTGFDKVRLGEASSRSFVLANPFPDRKNRLRSPFIYNLIIFDFVAGSQYRLIYTVKEASGAERTVVPAVTMMRFSSIVMTTTQPVSNAEVLYRPSSSAEWKSYEGDWALYDGMVKEQGTIDVEVTLRSAPQKITPGSPKYFDTIFFEGAEPGMKLTLGEGTWMRPVFYAQPAEGSALTFEDVCVHDASQMDFIDALRQMFNLRFYTDNRAKVVRVESADEFYSMGGVVDWTDKIDLSRPVAVEETGGDGAKKRAWTYRSGDGAVGRYNRSGEDKFGYWSSEVLSFAAEDGEQVWENEMFTPSITGTGMYSGAPSARLVMAGDAEAEAVERTENLNFLPKVVRFEGLKPLLAGESWGWPLAMGFYPKIAFHAPESGYSLCFEDRDGMAGLHSRYDRDVRMLSEGRRVTLWLALSSVEVSTLAFPTGHGADFRTLYRFTIDGESALYRLEEVCDYRPSDTSTKCVFVKHIPS